MAAEEKEEILLQLELHGLVRTMTAEEQDEIL